MKKWSMGGTGIAYGKSTHFLLKFAKFKNDYVTVSQVMAIAPGKWDAPYRVRDAFGKLEKNGLVTKNFEEDSWKITEKGVLFLHKSARKFVGEFK